MFKKRTLFVILLLIIIVVVSFLPYKKVEKFQLDFEDLNKIIENKPPVDTSNIKDLDLNTIKAKKVTSSSIGVGTDKPKQKIEIHDSTNDAKLHISAPNNHSAVQFASSGGSAEIVVDSKGKMIFQTPDDSNRMIINKNGLVGINTIEPKNRLHVDGWVRVGKHTLRSHSDKFRICDEDKKKCRDFDI